MEDWRKEDEVCRTRTEADRIMVERNGTHNQGSRQVKKKDQDKRRRTVDALCYIKKQRR